MLQDNNSSNNEYIFDMGKHFEKKKVVQNFLSSIAPPSKFARRDWICILSKDSNNKKRQTNKQTNTSTREHQVYSYLYEYEYDSCIGCARRTSYPFQIQTPNSRKQVADAPSGPQSCAFKWLKTPAWENAMGSIFSFSCLSYFQFFFFLFPFFLCRFLPFREP